MKTATAKQTNAVNGVDIDVLSETVDAIRQDPELGIARFRARNTWTDGNQNQSEVSGFYGAKQEIAHATTFRMYADEPPILAGNDAAPNPVEHLLHALASCLTTSMVAHAAVRGIVIDELEGTTNFKRFYQASFDPLCQEISGWLISRRCCFIQKQLVKLAANNGSQT